MTQKPQKNIERLFVEKTAKFLNKEWRLGPDQEIPDFIVTEGTECFGLEVCEIFTGPQNKSGSRMRKVESENQRRIDDFQTKYENENKGTPLDVKFLGDICDENLNYLLPILTEMDFSNKIPSCQHPDPIEIKESGKTLKVWVKRSFRANWIYMNDRVGWVGDAKGKIKKEIKNKSEKLPKYKENSGLDDIRLLVLANRIMNSGKLELRKYSKIDLLGFKTVYFFSYPSSITVFDDKGNVIVFDDKGNGKVISC